MLSLQRNKDENSVNRLARYIIMTVTAACICAVCWYFKEVIIYLVLAAVVALIGKPIMHLLRRIRYKSYKIPDVILAIITEILIFVVFITIVTQMIPIIIGIINTIKVNLQNSSVNLLSINEFGHYFNNLDAWLVSSFPKLSKDFRIEEWAMNYLEKSLNLSLLSSMLGSLASLIINTAIGSFSVVFISFFFLKDEDLSKKIMTALTPDHLEKRMIHAISDIETLLSRYFLGLILEITGVFIIDFLGLLLIIRLGAAPSMGIAFIAAMLNVIPYVGPWIGAILGVTMGVSLKLSSVLASGSVLDINVFVLILIMLAIFVFSQIVDNFVYQPLIYSTSIKARPLEIFVVLLIAGHIGGMLGMLVAIPSYTVLRVFASRFLGSYKLIQRLIPGVKDEEIALRKEEEEEENLTK